ncbi:ABC transporter ATP-binding protein [Butyrivibrio sp. MC2013]|uniref:ABC transporter ATP-binding protein n=1 Tax=Butyrivibrio sp. MC2013 TaxID=1280686 RepID=UPI0003F938EF|nr:ATP-binding cassette domain-containing protein [Butyrivibrio sp. MC2013]
MLEVRRLSKKYGRNWVLRDINLQLNKGHIYGFVGANGCGKSVLFKTICGFVKADEGEILYDGLKIGKDVDFIPSLGVLIEKPLFIEEYNHFQNLKYLARIRNEINDQTIWDSIEAVGLDLHNKNKVKKYSLGMRQRLGIAQAIMEKPDVLILDEPFNGLDKEGRSDITKIIKNYVTENRIVMLTSHIDGDIEQLADTVYEIENGNAHYVK